MTYRTNRDTGDEAHPIHPGDLSDDGTFTVPEARLWRPSDAADCARNHRIRDGKPRACMCLPDSARDA